MNKGQTNKKEMYDVALQYLNTNADKISAIPKLLEFKNSFNALTLGIEEAAQTQFENVAYMGKSKTQLKNTIANKLDILNDTLEVVALMNGDDAMAMQMDSSASGLFRLKNEDFVSMTKLIVDKTVLHQDELMADYGITLEQVEDIKQDVNEYLTLHNMPQAFRVAQTVNTSDLVELFKETDVLLDTKLDKMMKIFKNRDASFYKGYLSSRTIIDN